MMDIEKLRNMRLIPFESPFYFVHLHGLEVTDELAQEIRKKTTNLPHGKKLYGFDSFFDIFVFIGIVLQFYHFNNLMFIYFHLPSQSLITTKLLLKRKNGTIVTICN